MSGALVIGLCALSFAAGCVVTAVMLRRERTPEPALLPVLDDPAVAGPDLTWPPDDYATKPIHRNPVMGIPSALPPPEPSRPTLVVVPDPEPVTEAEQPVRQDEVRRMRVVRDVWDLSEPTKQLSMTGRLSGPVDAPDSALGDPALGDWALGDRSRPVDVPGAENDDEPEAATAAAQGDAGPAVVEDGPAPIHVPAQSCPVQPEARSEPTPDNRTSGTVDTDHRRSTLGNA